MARARRAPLANRIADAVLARLAAAERRLLSNRGGVHIFRPTFTKPDRADASKRVLKTSPHYAYRFQYHKKPYQEAGFKTAAAARTAGETRKSEVVAGHETDPRKYTVFGLYQRAAAQKVQWKPGTQRGFENVWRRIRKHLPDETRVADVDAAALLQLVAKWQQDGAAINSIRLNLDYLRAALQIAHEERRLQWLPKFPTLKRQRREQTIHPVQLEQILAKMPAHYRPLFEVAEITGWRIDSELRSRKWIHVEWGPDRWLCECQRAIDADACAACGACRPGQLHLDAASCKTGEPRVFPMRRRLLEILREQRAAADRLFREIGRRPEHVFFGPDGAQAPHYRASWRRALLALGVKKLDGRKGAWSSPWCPHDVRRTRVRKNRRLGVDRDVAMALVGHASAKSHEMYLERGPDPDALRATALALDRLEAQERKESNVEQLELFRRR